MKKKLFSVFLFLSLAISSEATHIIGGEFSYKCLGGNQYEFTVKVYRDCYNSFTGFDNPAYFTVFDSSNNVVANPTATLLSTSIIPITSSNPCLVIPPNICVQEGIYVFQLTLPPSPGGYTISYQRCCRNHSILNLQSPGATGATYFAEINDSAISMCNSGPVFERYPPVILCLNTPFVYDHSASEQDGDSLVYELCRPFAGATESSPMPVQTSAPPFPEVNYVSPFSFTNPMGGSPSLVINPESGILTVTPNTIGQFVVGICVKEYRHGVYLGRYYRDFQFNVVNCDITTVASIPSVINNCSGNLIQFQNFSTGADDYRWDFGVSGITDDTSILQYPAYTFPDTGVYLVTLIASPEGSSCSDTATCLVYVYTSLTAKIITPTTCINKSVLFSDKSTSTYGHINSWSWAFGDNNASTVQNPSHTYSAPGNYTVTMIVGTDRGCADTISQTTVVNPSPTVGIANSDTAICYLDNVALLSTATGANTYQWSPNYNINSTTVQNPVVSPDVTTTYHVTVSNAFGCTAADFIEISVLEIFADAGHDTVLCAGRKLQLQGSAAGLSFQWSPASTLNNSQILNPVASPAANTSYILTVTAGSCISRDTVSVKVKPYPSITAGTGQTICRGDTALLSATGCTAYSWAPAESALYPDKSTTPAFPATTTTYTVSGTDTAKCDTVVTDVVIVTVHEPPETMISNDTTIVLGTSVNLWASGGISYRWSPVTGLNNITVSNPSANPTVTTTYYVTIISPNGCLAIDSVVVHVLPEPIVKFPSGFSPNADNKNDFFRPMVVGPLTNIQFKIYSRWGKLVYESTDALLKGWDGTYKGVPQEVGVYVYLFEGTRSSSGTSIQLKGNVFLLR